MKNKVYDIFKDWFEKSCLNPSKYIFFSWINRLSLDESFETKKNDIKYC